MKTIFLSFSIKNSSVAAYFIEVANQLSHDYSVIILTYGETPHPFEISAKVKIFKWPSPRPTGIHDFFFLIRKIRQYRPAVMISNFGAVNLFSIVGFIMKVKQRIAWHRTLLVQLERKQTLIYRKKMIFKMATKVIANSTATKNDLIRNFGVKEDKVQVLYNAVRDPQLSNPEVVDNKIIYVGRMDHVKGVRTLIEATPIIIKRFPEAEVVLVGGNLKGKKIRKYKEVVKNLAIERNVRFTGNLDKAKVLKEFSNAYVTVVPSIVEAFGYVVIESFSVKTPVIGSNTTGIAEIIRNNVDGLLFEPQNHEDLAEKILILMENKEMRDSFSDNCYERFKNYFEVQAAAHEFINTLNLAGNA